MEIGKYISLGSGVQVRKNKNETYTYYYNYREKNKAPKRVKLFVKDKDIPKNLKEAIALSLNIQDIKSQDITSRTLNDIADKYFESRYNKKRNQLRQKYNHLTGVEFENSKVIKKALSSVRTEEQKYNNNIRKSPLAKLVIKSIDENDIDNYTYKYLPTRNLSEKSAHHIVSMIKTIFNYGLKKKFITGYNPFEYVKFSNPKNKRLRYLNETELTRLLKACKEYKSNPNVYLVLYLGVLTAARAGTVLNIKKKDIDIDNKQITLSNFKASKTYKVSLNKESVDWLDKEILSKIDNNDYLIQPTNKRYIQNPQQPLSEVPEKIYKIMDELFNEKLDKSINSDRNQVVNFHTIRRSIATNLAIRETSIYNIMTLLNHSSIKQTQDYLNLEHLDVSKDTDSLFASIFEELIK